MSFIASFNCKANFRRLMCSFSQEKITGTQWDLLIPNLEDPERFALVRENVGLISSGSSPRSAGTLKVGLKKIIELKKKNREPPGVKLRCSNRYCQSYNSLLSYSSITQVTHTCGRSSSKTRKSYYQCVGCGSDRTGNYRSCVGCGKKFI